MVEVYGISGCTTVKKSLVWLEAHGIKFNYTHFQKVDGLESQIEIWMQSIGKERLLNQKARNFKALDIQSKKLILQDDHVAIKEMAKLPQLMKRPILRKADILLAGFNEQEWRDALGL